MLVSILLICVRILTQCHADDPSSPHYTVTYPSVTKARELKPCDLATGDEVNAALGAPSTATDLAAEPPLYNTCNYHDATGTRLLVVAGLSIVVDK
ncbi:hypothetical protein P3T37_003030 [Kitasatospora sp. MAA4]|uniref:hypothetical protein n=1 Tax=Kitasatospora sp. MAA4 TaxID=3035093 RepID=UPI00247531BC|nr:hypothetical protein [Kitasatospora sp. MAA4]MDH6133634.1 hypothetical protein [Kitasatospora sp. MAA4]